MKLILKDAGADPENDMAPQEGIDQVLNASHGQIRGYMDARAEAMNE